MKKEIYDDKTLYCSGYDYLIANIIYRAYKDYKKWVKSKNPGYETKKYGMDALNFLKSDWFAILSPHISADAIIKQANE